MNFISRRLSFSTALIVALSLFNLILTSAVSAAPSEKQLASQSAKQNLTAAIGDMPNKLPATRVEISKRWNTYRSEE